MFKIFSKYICREIFKMQRLEVSCAVRRIYTLLGAKGLTILVLRLIKYVRTEPVAL